MIPSKKLLDAMIQVESSGNDQAIGDNGEAVGPLQIRPIMVDEVNRIVGQPVFKLEDRTDRAKSQKMAEIFLHHHSQKIPQAGEEHLARMWNGGPSGHTKAATVPYWEKVKKAMGPKSGLGAMR